MRGNKYGGNIKRFHFSVNFFARTMQTAFILVFGFLFSCVQCFDSESFEYNGIEVSPLYETIIYSDIADILKEFDNNNAAKDKANNESDSEEDVEDLLSEYHHYLEKAHKQRVNYLEKNKLKNKVPIIRHEKFTKLKSPIENKHNDFYKNGFFKPEHKFPAALNPFNMFIPFNSNKFVTSELPPYSNDLSSIKKFLFIDESPVTSFANVPGKSSCCKDGHMSCKQCSLPLDHNMQGRSNPNVMLSADDGMSSNTMFPEPSEDTINVRVKVDIQLPKLQSERLQLYNPQSKDKMTDIDTGLSKEYLSAIRIPSPYFNFPIPLNIFGHSTIVGSKSSHDISNPLHKLTVHKKKKSKTGNTNKKHRKKVITFHNFKIEPELSYALFNMTAKLHNNGTNNTTAILNLQSNNTQKEYAPLNISTTTTPVTKLNISEAQTEENILLLVNITNNIENGTIDSHKTENSIETEYTNAITNSTTEKPLHRIRKREISSDHKPSVHKDKPITHKPTKDKKDKSTKSSTSIKPSASKSSSLKNKNQKKVTKKATVVKKKPSSKLLAHKAAINNNSSLVKEEKEKIRKKSEENLAKDLELLFWPNTNSSKTKDIMKDITAIILENENKKAKLNMSSEAIHRNHTRALEQAIFGNIDWNDVDTVAPAFISFVGKYIEGIITFCNEHICHSMKCSKQSCVHRYCAPKDRYNKGHCTGSNYTDSVASMESINDLPSNVAFEIVDILEDRMSGKLFGKITLCISSKCITFEATKKEFHKYKCVNTENTKKLDARGHCKET